MVRRACNENSKHNCGGLRPERAGRDHPLVRRPGSAEDVPDAEQLIFQVEREPEEIVPTVSKTLFREFYDRLIPEGTYGPNPDPKWSDLFVVFSDGERACISAALGEEGLAVALQSSVFHEVEEDEPRLQDALIFGCLSDDTVPSLTHAMFFAGIVRGVDPISDQHACFQELLELAVAALSNPSSTEEETFWPVFGFMIGLAACGLEADASGTSAPGG